ncbi:RnfABCDGE type electron transport complex subunit G [Paludibacter sp. 221]|uniref:RnfABCDGE type electron transport complex subunit G n=1 Tax=Paludibacter sp. 221 TaxID=2302939 RepID=UPI0013D79CAD|nr:RnfABCDGE type electron transport complex subunit G [Paludibacter sp. 221]NDV46549.1 RnfABCDGE type electron transport complex subunit G [Paludibacter sp. 221]
MAKLESSFKNMLLVLTCITLFAGGILAGVYTLTKEPIEKSKLAKQQNAIKEVLPPFDSLDDEGKVVVIEKDGKKGEYTVYTAYDANGSAIGAAVESFSNGGFSGEIKVMVGFDINNKIVDYSVLEQKETPGLGTKMVDWFKTDKGNQNIKGKNPSASSFKVNKDGGEIDAITAATISSRAFLEAVKDAYAAYTNNADATTDSNSGATTVENTEGSEETTVDAEDAKNDATTAATATTTDGNSGATQN